MKQKFNNFMLGLMTGLLLLGSIGSGWNVATFYNFIAGDGITFVTNGSTVTIGVGGDTPGETLTMTNIYSTTVIVTNSLTVYSNTYLSNVFENTTIITNSLTVYNNSYFSNLYSYDIFVSNSITINSNLTAKTVHIENNYTTNQFIVNGTTYDIHTNSLSDTNLVVDMQYDAQTISAPSTFQILQTTNRPDEGKTRLAHLRIQNFQETNIQVAINTAPGWRTYGITSPLTITNGDIVTITFEAWGPTETNVLVGHMNPFH